MCIQEKPINGACHTETFGYNIQNMDKQCVTPVTAIDLSAAFDMVNHSLLLKILIQMYSIKGTALKWFDSYLTDCSVCMQINKSVPQELDLPFSVPQGSCAGPILFNIFISVSLPTSLTHLIVTFWVMQMIIQSQPAQTLMYKTTNSKS